MLSWGMSAGCDAMEILLIGLGLYFVFPALFYWFPFIQRQLIFMNMFQWCFRTNYFQPSRHNISRGRNFYLKSETGVTIGIWQLLPKSEANKALPDGDQDWEAKLHECGAPIILYFHGNMGNRATGHRIDLYNLLQDHGYHVIAFDYRGFGDSLSAVPLTETGVVADAFCVYKWILDVLSRKPPSNNSLPPIFFWGHSLGTAISLHLAAELSTEANLVPPAGIILEAPFTNMVDAAMSSLLSLIYRPLPCIKSLLSSKFRVNDLAFESDRYVKEIVCPIQILHARLDMVVPFRLGEELFQIALQSHPDGDWETILFTGFKGQCRRTAHVLIWQEPDLCDILRTFVTHCSQSQVATS